MKLRFRANAYEPQNFDWYVRESKVGDFGDVHIKAKDGSEMLLEMRSNTYRAKYGCYWTWHDFGLPVEPQEASGSIRRMLSLLPASEEEIAEAEEKILRYFSIFPSYRDWKEDVYIIRKDYDKTRFFLLLEKHTGKERIEVADESFFYLPEEDTYTRDFIGSGSFDEIEKSCMDALQSLCDGRAKVWDIENDFDVGMP